jgi:hypothetical protein
MMTSTDDDMMRWIKRFPGYCTFCKGEGGHEFYENHGLPGQGERLFEPCDALPECYCHRCGKGDAVDVDPADGQPAPCSYCGWANGTGADDVMPSPRFVPIDF